MPTKAGQASDKAIPKAIKVAFNACRIPDHDDVFYCTLTVANVGLAKTASAAEARTAGGLLRRKAFETAAVETLEAARAAGQDVEITFIEFVGADGFRQRLGSARWEAFYADAGSVLRSGAIDCTAPGAIARGRSGFVPPPRAPPPSAVH